MKKIALFTFLFSISLGFSQIQAPEKYIYNYGKKVSYYYEIENYFEHLCKESKLISKVNYGKTYQDKNLNAYILTSENNHSKLDMIRKNHLYQIGMSTEKPSETIDKTIIWLSFNVHGNEIGAIESSLSVVYQLLNDAKYQPILEECVIILDPCLNPDGFSRYVQWQRDNSGKRIHPEKHDREHMEAWSNGRNNHYHFDLNRDWAWQTQVETQQRSKFYNQWMPMIHTDVHEMGPNEPYFMPPSADPFHEQVADFQVEMHKKIGAFTSKEFDNNNWMYYSGERFDLFYPSYGDTWPTFNGAIGTTYEQGGIGAGRAEKLRNGQILTIQDRIDHHKIAILANVQVAYQEREFLKAGFRKYFQEQRKNPKGNYKTYIVKHSAKNKQLTQLLDLNGIEYSFANEKSSAKGYHFQSFKEKSFDINKNDLIVSVNQPKSVLAQVLFEPEHKLSDSLSYDITAWNVPLAYNSEAYAVKNYLTLSTIKKLEIPKIEIPKQYYAIYIPWNSRISAQVLSHLHQQKAVVRMVAKDVVFDGINLQKGGIIITKPENTNLDFEQLAQDILNKKDDIVFLKTGYGGKGGDLGGENYELLKAPKILLMAGRKVSELDFGMAQFFVENVIDYPLSVVEMEHYHRINFSDFNTIILMDGNYDSGFEKEIHQFVENGGKVIAMDGALSIFEDKNGFALTKFATEDEKKANEDNQKSMALKNRQLEYEKLERNAISDYIIGAIVENNLNQSHPLAFGLGEKYFSLKTTNQAFKLLKDAVNVSFTSKKYYSTGFIGHLKKKELEETVSFAVDNSKRGTVIYMMDNPLFRGFWENGNLLFANAVFLVR
jgi:Zinc carboxypeptidase